MSANSIPAAYLPAPHETLRQKQSRFVRMLNGLVDFAESRGYELTLGDGYRDPRVFGSFGERKGYGESYSCHKMRLAQDYNLFKNGTWLQTTEDFLPLGEWWEAMGGAWGGRFQDGNHFSLEYEGRK